MSQSTLILVDENTIVNWLQISRARRSVNMAQPENKRTLVELHLHDSNISQEIIGPAADRLWNHLRSIAEDLTVPPPEVDQVPTAEEHTRSFADRFVRPST